MKLDPNTSKEVLSSAQLLSLLKPDSDPWDNTPLQGYVNKNNSVKGKYGELFVEILMQKFGHEVGKAKTSKAGHDRIINGILVEIKFGAAHRNPKKKNETRPCVYSFNHFSVSKDWERAIIIGVNIDCEPYAVWFSKEDFTHEVRDGSSQYFSRQQAGKSNNNDDWMFMTNPDSWNSFINQPWVKSIDKW